MRDSNIIACIALSLFAGASANKDAITLITTGDSWITEAVATLVVPKIPQPVTGDVAFWSAIMMDDYNGDFLQGVTQSSPANSGYCPDADGPWCNFAYKLKDNNPTVGNAVVANPGSRVTTHYKLNAQTGYWDQKLYINNQLQSNISTSHGQHGNYFFVSVECASGTCAKAPAHHWDDISLVLNKADAGFGHSGSWAFGATGGLMSTPDHGKTWNFTRLEVPETSIELNQS